LILELFLSVYLGDEFELVYCASVVCVFVLVSALRVRHTSRVFFVSGQLSLILGCQLTCK